MAGFLDMIFGQRRGNMLAPLDTRPDPQNYPIASPDMLAAVAAPVPQPVQGAQVAGSGGRASDSSFLTPDRKAMLNDIFLGWAAGATPQQSLALGAANASKGSSTRKIQNETVNWLKGRGVSDGDAAMLASNPSALNEYIQGIYKPQKSSLVNAGGSLYNPDTGEWITPPAGASRPTEYGLNLVYGKDANGKTVAFQLSKDGTYKPFEPPQGVELTPGTSQVDTGTGTVLLNSKTGEQVGTIAKDVAGAANQSATGKNTAEATNALPNIETSSQYALDTINKLSSDPYLSNMLGPVDSRLPNLTTDAARVQGLMNQVQGQTFLQAFNSLRGGGAITEVEGQKAEQALARLNTAQSDKDYRKALSELQGIIQQGVENARRRAGQGGAQQPATSPANNDPLGIR